MLPMTPLTPLEAVESVVVWTVIVPSSVVVAGAGVA